MNLLPPSPLGSPPGSGFWNDWYEKLRVLVNTIASGFSWTLITDKPTTIAGFGITDGVSTSGTLTTNAIILGAGSHAVSALGSLGTTTTLLHGNAAGAPTFGAVTLTTDVTGILPVANGGTGVTTSTGTTNVVLSNTPTLVTPVIGAATGTSVALTSLSTINSNAASLPTSIAGTLLQLGAVDGTSTRLLNDSFGSGSPTYIGRRALTSAAAPSAVGNGDVLVQIHGYGYGTTTYSATARTVIRGVANQSWTDANQGSRLEILTTPNGSTTATLAATFANDQSLTIAAGITHGSATLLTTTTALTNGAAAQAGTLLNSPTAGNPTKWIPINDNGTTRYIPCW